MLRLHEFITIIRNTKTSAQQRAQYQKQMSAIRESFGKNQQSLRPRNVTKLLFINMSGQQTNFGQMECLNLITANSLIEKRIGYLGLTQLFHEKSELLMMATNRLKIDLGSVNNSIVSLVLCVISQICTVELARELHNQVLKCIANNNAYIRKKAILTAIRIIKKCPQYVAGFLPKIISCLDQKNHGVLLACMAFLQNAIYIDQENVAPIINIVSRIGKLYRMVVNQHNTQYQIGGVQDPFLQVAILKLIRLLKKYDNTFDKIITQVLITSHDSVCLKISSNNLKNGANAVLLECFQLFMLLNPQESFKQMVSNVLTRFISNKDANTKYLSLFNLNLMAKYDLSVVKTHKSAIFECLYENDNLIKNMAIDILYLIAEEDNSASIVKELLNNLLSATDEQFIPELALKICLIVEKHSVSRRWHFDTILKVLVLADQSVKEDSAKSLVHLITSTPQLQDYCMAKLFFSTCENIQNDALAKLSIYLLGQIGEVLLRNKTLSLTETVILDLIETIIFRIGAAFDTITYALSALLKLHDKFPSEKVRISRMIKSFETHSDLQVQKRACQYVKLLEPIWDEQRTTEICIPIPPFRQTAQAFKAIPIGQTSMDIDLSTIKLPKKLNINYQQNIQTEQNNRSAQREVVIATGKQTATVVTQKPKQNIFDDIMGTAETKPVVNAFGKKKEAANSLMDDDDIFNTITGGSNPPKVEVKTQPNNASSDIFGFMDLNIGGNTQPANTATQQPFNNSGFDMGLLGIGNISIPQTTNNSGFGNDLLGFGSSPVKPTSQPQISVAQSGFNWNSQPVNQPQVVQQVKQVQQNTNKILAYQNNQIQIWMNCSKQTHEATKIIATYVNKTQAAIEGLTIQAAVMKHLKLTINPLNTTTVPPMSIETVNQIMNVINSAVGQKPIVMKMKISYSHNGQKLNFQQKIANFPANM